MGNRTLNYKKKPAPTLKEINKSLDVLEWKIKKNDMIKKVISNLEKYQTINEEKRKNSKFYSFLLLFGIRNQFDLLKHSLSNLGFILHI